MKNNAMKAVSNKHHKVTYSCAIKKEGSKLLSTNGKYTETELSMFSKYRLWRTSLVVQW